ncbi:Tim44/TimA family putative adaptor protein [Ketogulonicigenium vulgare]|uniref:Import inner membrane translocase, subunit Tim44 n=1 Tax=Ketogulonicigenium vulgare (strain WSH-001) TaxID=759362 RepID=F9Y696_KETVW|nr:Tim44/TimA family putative adaptor protein [Ketogulonicigenium vulgare]ADO43835.1 transporter, Tim44 family protein [Ketogulonicigenium vulgare Y25]AEM42093.1 Import inner membrane translocase, subunit Tim44 [Ketogulonicigenium vulgare WSH-001]ALJ79722.1 preprotein translocase subunit Tim44 [Ketogulonicigenium vulgare]ANW32646.1 preprotein translocase subunit Tim44 [Ketogulonicigenium vulgare]AOZ55869.1 transporter Tim44 family protein [Ketogulonicigenium vulgare]
MNSPIIQIIILAAIAIFLILRLRSVLGSRDGFEKPIAQVPPEEARKRPTLDVIEGGPDRDIVDHVPEGSATALIIGQMKKAEPSFSLSEFLSGSRGAYEMILMAFERGDIEPVRGFIAPEVFDAFAGVIADRQARGLKVEAHFIGIRDVGLDDAAFDPATGEAELVVRFVAEMTSVVRDADGTVVEGAPDVAKRQKDVWTFARKMGASDPNWTLVATGG